jgi:drug/metabolite transporter, DME family
VTRRVANTSTLHPSALGATALFASTGLVTIGLGSSMPPLALAAWRLLIGGAVLVGVDRVGRSSSVRPPMPRGVAWSGALATVVFQVGWFVGVGRVGVGLATVVALGAAPGVALLVDATARRVTVVIGTVCCLAGLVVSSSVHGSADLLGVVAAAFGGAAIPVYASAIESCAVSRGPLGAAAAVFGRSSVVATGVIVGSGSLPRGGVDLAVIGYLGVVTLALAYVLWSVAVVRVGVHATVIASTLEPVLAGIGAAWLLGEPWGAGRGAGLALVVVGVLLTSRRPAIAPVR